MLSDMETAFPTPPIYRITIPGLLRDKSRPLGLDREGRGVSFTPVRLPDDIDFLMRPVLAGLCHMESRDNGAISNLSIPASPVTYNQTNNIHGARDPHATEAAVGKVTDNAVNSIVRNLKARRT